MSIPVKQEVQPTPLPLTRNLDVFFFVCFIFAQSLISNKSNSTEVCHNVPFKNNTKMMPEEIETLA